ncbi:MAG: Holliday junction branch migration protein RuvA [Brevinematia bacterium]
MIDYIKGKVVEIEENKIILEVNGIGYLIFVPLRIVEFIQEEKEYKFYIHKHNYEKGEDLYGFLDKEERKLFNLLTEVSNIGPKIAFKILSYLTPEQIITSIISGNTKTISSIKGVGEKAAERIVNELKREISKLGIEAKSEKSNFEELVIALRTLGFNQNEILKAINNAKKDTSNIFSLETSKAIQICLKYLR